MLLLLFVIFSWCHCAQVTNITNKRLPFSERTKSAKNPMMQRLIAIIEQKKTNLCVAIDVNSKKELLAIAEKVGSFVCCVKTHIDMIDDFDWDCVVQLKSLADKYNFLIVEDRKFCDIGATVQQQYVGGIYKIAQWADIVIAHAISGPDIISALKNAKNTNFNEHALLLVAQMSSSKNLIDEEYTETVVKIAQNNQDFVIGLVCQQRCSQDPALLHFTPGVHITNETDTIGQQYNRPEKVIKECGIDIVIVGRGICKASDICKAAEDYRNKSWAAYQETIMPSR